MHSEAMKLHFGQLARSYDKLRLPDDKRINLLVEKLVEAGDLRGRKVLDVGCGTGRTLSALVLRYNVQGWGIDASPEMLEVARAQVPPTVTLQQATVEALPFSESFFERVYMTMVVHLLNYSLAFPEIWRVLQPGGRIVIMTPDLISFERNWLAPLFPSYTRVEYERFPDRATLEEALTRAGFASISCLPLSTSQTFSKEDALRKLRGRHVSTFALLDNDEYQAGVARAEQELPETITSTQDILFISAVKPL